MLRRVGLAAIWVIAAGCVPGPGDSSLVPSNPFGDGNKVRTPTPYEASDQVKEEGVRVAQLGQKILADNPGLNVQPKFLLLGDAREEIFHRGADTIFISEGLAQKCTSDNRLAAVLCHELGKMSAEREALERFRPQSPGREPPMDVPVGNDYHGTLGTADNTHNYELARYEQERKRSRSTPDALARVILQKAGYKAEDLTEAAPLLRAADGSAALENQLDGRGLPQTPAPSR